MKRKNGILPSILALSFGVVSDLYGAGLEKSILWSGELAGSAGASSISKMGGSQSLAFNPAGLGLDENMDFGLHLSPTYIESSSPGYGFHHSKRANHWGVIPAVAFKFVPRFDFIKNSDFIKNIGVAFGIYPIGGSKSRWESDEDLSNWNLPKSFKETQNSELSITEYSVGMGIKIWDDFTFGMSYRMVESKGQMTTSSIIRLKNFPTEPYMARKMDINDLKGVDPVNYRLGLMYNSPDSKWGAGVSYRSSSDIKMNGKLSGTDYHTELSAKINSQKLKTIPTPELEGARKIQSSPIDITIHFPSQFSYGFYYKPWMDHQFFFTHNVTFYSKTKKMLINATAYDPVTKESSKLPDIEHHWKDMNNFRFGYETTLLPIIILRAGYMYTDRVTNENYARDTFSAPGVGHSFTVGAGKNFNQYWTVDLAYEYSRVSGEGRTTQRITTSKFLEAAEREGRFTNKSHAAHLSVTYKY